MTEYEYSILFPKSEAYFTESTLTFSIGNMRCRENATVYFIFYSYDMQGNLIDTYVSDRWVVDRTYSPYYHTFELPAEIVSNSSYYQLELIAVDVSSENPLYFNHLMLEEGEYTGYHIPHDIIKEKEIRFVKSRYANLYDNEGNYLQVIRPLGNKITTTNLPASKITVLAPHFYDEDEIDDPINLFYEYMNQTEQTINVLR